jgi:ribosomal protein S1
VGDGVEGLLHISELSWEHVERVEDVVQVGQQLRVKVLQADEARRRISLSLKQVEEPAETAVPEPQPVEVGYEEPVVVAEREPAYAEVSASPQG